MQGSGGSILCIFHNDRLTRVGFYGGNTFCKLWCVQHSADATRDLGWNHSLVFVGSEDFIKAPKVNLPTFVRHGNEKVLVGRKKRRKRHSLALGKSPHIFPWHIDQIPPKCGW
jgi:hypothetical protein